MRIWASYTSSLPCALWSGKEGYSLRYAKRILVISTITVLLCSFVLVANNISADFSYRIKSFVLSDYKINLGGWMEDVKPVTTEKRYEHAIYTRYDYKKDGRFFRLTIAKIKNGDILYFAENHATPKANKAFLQITVKENEPRYVHMFAPGKPPAWQRWDELPNSLSKAAYVDGQKLFYRIGKAEVYRPLGYTVYEELPYYASDVQVVQNGYTQYKVTLPADSTSMSTAWGILAGHPLINWNEAKAYKKALEIEFEHDKKLRADGAYSIIPENYEPSSKMAFYRNPANGEGLRANDFVSYPAMGSLFMDIATHLAYTAVQSQNEEGYWPTYPRSQWLRREYNIDYAYMDNRRNADNALFLLRYVQQKPDPDIRETLRKWDHYMLRYIDKYSQKAGDKTISFIPDYVGAQNSRRTHTSLNHLAANMNYLLEAYLYDQNPAKKQAASKLFAAIKATKEKWVRPDSNFYYALTPGLMPYPAEDYYKLTHDDLLHSQKLLVLLYGKPSDALQYLITKKEKWMQKHPVPTLTFPDIKTP